MTSDETDELPALKRGILKSTGVRSSLNVLLWILAAAIVGLCLFSAAGCAPRVAFWTPPAPQAMEPDPLKAYLVYGVLFGILGIGVGVAMFVWLPFKKTAVAIAAGSGAIIAVCLMLRSVLPYIGWIMLAATAIGAAAVLWHNRRLLVAARESWDHVPDDAKLSDGVEKLMNRIA